MQQLRPASLKLIVSLLGAAVFACVSLLIISQQHSLRPLETSLDNVRAFNGLAQQVFAVRLQVEHFLASNTRDAYAASEQQLEQTLAALHRAVETAAPVDYLLLSRLEQTTADYLNLLRGLGSLAFNDAPADTRQTLRQQLGALGAALDQQAYAALEHPLSAAEQVTDDLSASVVLTGVLVLLLLVILFAASLFLVLAITQHNAYALQQISRAAQLITKAQYDTQIDLSHETNPDIIQLGTAFNRMTETLRKALHAESDAQRQNYLQLMKLAREEQKTAVLEERQRIARELHDSVKQQLFSITLSARAAANLLDHAPEHVRTHLEHIAQVGHGAQSEMTTLLQELIPVSTQEKRLEDALTDYLHPLCEVHGLKLHWRVTGTNTLTIAQEHALFRAVQEAVSNVVRHSGASILHVSCNFGLITHVIVEDNGQGFVTEAVPSTSSGLSLMRARLMRAGGRFELQTAPGAGTRLTLMIDLRRASFARA